MYRQSLTASMKSLDINEFKKETGLRFREMREAIGYTQRQLGELLGSGQTGISALETGTTSLSIEVMHFLEAQFSVSPRFLTAGKGPIFLEKAEAPTLMTVRRIAEVAVEAVQAESTKTLYPLFDEVLSELILTRELLEQSQKKL